MKIEPNFDANNIKVVAIDIDGTLINSNHQCTDYTKDVVQKIRETGREVVIVTGRGSLTAMPFAEAINLEKYMINCNGAVIWNIQKEQNEEERVLSDVDAKQAIKWSRDLGIVVIAYANNGVFYELDNEIKNHYFKKISVPVPKINFDDRRCDDYQKFFYVGEEESIKKLAHECENYSNVSWFMTHPALHSFTGTNNARIRSLEIMAPETNKGATLKRLVEKLGFTMDQVVAFGDDLNDVEMLSLAGVGVAMGNARAEVKEAAKYETLTNDENGVAVFLEKYILN